MTPILYIYLLGVAAWLVIWVGAFSVSALASRRRWHGSTQGDVLLTVRDLIGAALTLCPWLLLRNWLGNWYFRFDLQPLYAELLSGRSKVLDWTLGGTAIAGTVLYLLFVARRGIRRLPTPNMYMQRHPLIPLRILSFVIFQQAAASLLLLDWTRLYIGNGKAEIWTAVIFGLTHLGAACFGLPLRQAVLLTLGSGAAMFLWGSLRIYAHSLWAPLLTHYLFYIVLACHHARLRSPAEERAAKSPAQPS